MTLKILGEFKDGDPNQGTTTYPDGEKEDRIDPLPQPMSSPLIHSVSDK